MRIEVKQPDDDYYHNNYNNKIKTCKKKIQLGYEIESDAMYECMYGIIILNK
jgi:hypothetical protein